MKKLISIFALLLLSFAVNAQTLSDRVAAANQNIPTQATINLQLVNDLSTTLQSTQASLTSTQQQLVVANGNVATANAQVTTLSAQIITLQGSVTTLTAQLAAANAQIVTDASNINTLNAQIASLQSQIANFTCPAPIVCPLPPAPPVVTPPPPTTDTSAVLTWDAVVGATGYRVYFGTRSGVYNQTLGQGLSTTLTTYTVTNLTPGFTYFFVVTAQNALAESGFSNEVSKVIGTVVADTQAPTVPTGLKTTLVSTTQINIAWTASTDNVAVTSYQVFLNGTKISDQAGLTFNQFGLTPGTVSNFSVSASDAAGNVSAKSPTLAVTTLTTTESPNLTKVTAAGVGSITDSHGTVFTLGPKNPAVEGGKEFQVVVNGVPFQGAATSLCYSNHVLFALSTGLFFSWNGNWFDGPVPAAAGC